jgi:hypothetical protein
MSENVFAYRSNTCSGRFRDYGVLPDPLHLIQVNVVFAPVVQPRRAR